MARYQKQRQTNYPMGSVISGTMRTEDLIPAFLTELEYRLKHGPSVSHATRKAHYAILNARVTGDESYWDSEQPDMDLEILFDALGEYAGPYFYFGAHPGDGADYGYWLSEEWDEEFVAVQYLSSDSAMPEQLKVSDLADVPKRFRGEVAVVNDHGNVTLYRKTSRALHEVWSIV